MHLIWLSVILPLMLFVIWAFPESRRPRIWSLCFGLAILGIVAVIGVDLFGLYQGGGKPEHGFMRALFAIIQATDIPAVAFTVGSVLNWVVCRRLFKTGSTTAGRQKPLAGSAIQVPSVSE